MMKKQEKYSLQAAPPISYRYPKRWIAENQVKKGSFIKLREEEGGLLTIVPQVLQYRKGWMKQQLRFLQMMTQR